MTIEEFIKRFKEIAKENNLTVEISDEEFAKMFISHIVVGEWQAEEQKKFARRKKTIKHP